MTWEDAAIAQGQDLEHLDGDWMRVVGSIANRRDRVASLRTLVLTGQLVRLGRRAIVQKFDGWKPEPKPDWWMSREALLELARLMEEQKAKVEWDAKFFEQLPPGCLYESHEPRG